MQSANSIYKRQEVLIREKNEKEEQERLTMERKIPECSRGMMKQFIEIIKEQPRHEGHLWFDQWTKIHRSVQECKGVSYDDLYPSFARELHKHYGDRITFRQFYDDGGWNVTWKVAE
jgi:hypothetical protein